MTQKAGWEFDISEWLLLVDKMIDAPHNATAGLERVLEDAFDHTQAQVHVLSGSLRASGRTSSDVTDAVWHGEISYGGSSSGYPNDPVVYEWFERRRGGSHDFMAGIEDYANDFIEACEDWL